MQQDYIYPPFKVKNVSLSRRVNKAYCEIIPHIQVDLDNDSPPPPTKITQTITTSP